MTDSNQRFTDCPLEYTTHLLGGKWKIKLIWAIYEAEQIRFNQLKCELDGITDLMLTKVLKELAKENIVTRKQYNEIPPRVEYSLTENGLKLVDTLNEVTKTKSTFPSDESLLKIIYLASQNIMKKWTIRYRNWDSIYNQLSIFFDGRI